MFINKFESNNQLIDIISKQNSEISSLNSKIESLKEENYLLKNKNNELRLKYKILQDHFEYFSDWINNSPCQLVTDSFARTKIELPILD